MNKYKILFVDDDQFIRKIYTDRLQASGIDVTIADSAATAKSAIEANQFDLICLDHMLAAETGLDVLKWIRNDKKLQTPVMIFSASSHDKKISEFMEAGATEYIQKDHVVPSELVKKMLTIIESKK